MWSISWIATSPAASRDDEQWLFTGGRELRSIACVEMASRRLSHDTNRRPQSLTFLRRKTKEPDQPSQISVIHPS